MDSHRDHRASLCCLQHQQQTVRFVYIWKELNLNHFSSIYDMALLTYLIAFGHFFSEFLIFRTIKFGAGLLGPAIVSSTCTYIHLAKLLNERFSHDADLDDCPV